MTKRHFLLIIILLPVLVSAQLNIRYYLGAGRVDLFKQRFPDAINRFTKILEVKPEYAEAYFLRGIAKYNLGDYLGAKEDFSDAIKINPFYAEAYHYRGLTKEQLNDFNDALTDFELALQMDPTKPMIYVHRGLTYLMNDKFVEARNDFNEALRLNSTLPAAYLNRSIAWLELKDTANAMEDLNYAIKLNPFEPEAFRRRGLVNYLDEKYVAAIEDYNRALRLEEQNSLVMYQRALAYYKKGDYDKALNDYNTVITLDPDNSLAIYNRALLHSEMGRYNDAIEDYTKVAEINPDNILVYYNRAGVKIETNDLDGALKDYDKAIEIFPDFATAYINRSVVKQRLGMDKGAWTDRKKAEKIISEYKKTHEDSTYEAFRDTSKNLAALVDFNSEFNNSFSRDRLQNKNVQITLKDNFILIPADNDINPEGVLFVQALFDEQEASSRSWKWLPDTWKEDNEELLARPNEIDSIKDNSDLNEVYNYIISQSIKNNFHQSLKALNNGFLPNTWQHNFIKGTVKAQMADYIESKNDYVTEITLNEDPANINSGSPSRELADYNDAIEDLSRSIELNNKFSLSYYNRGNLECKSRNFKQAIDDYTQAIKLDEVPQAYFNRGLTLIYLKETEKGCLDISKAGEMGIDEAYNVIKRYCVKEEKE